MFQENHKSVTSNTHTSIIVDRNQALAHLKVLGYNRGDAVYIRAFFPKEDPRYGPNTGRKANKLNWEQVESWQAQGYGIHIVVNGGGHKDEDVTRCRAIFMEHDNLEIELQRNLWQTLGLPEPTLQVQTRKSVHSYWAITPGCSVEEWKPLQADLLTYASADLALKNPSRMMRLAGAYHIKPGHEPLRCDIIHNSGKRYSYEELRAAIPLPPPEPSAQPLLPSVPKHQSSSYPLSATPQYQHYEEITVPVREAIPLEACLSKESRFLLNSGMSEGGRNTNGAKLARDLIGTASHLQSIEQPFEGEPQLLLNEYASRCTPPLPSREVDAIWKSALKDNPTPSCQSVGVETCIRAWYWKHHVKSNSSTWKSNNHFSGWGFGSNNSGSGGNKLPIAALTLCDGPSANRLRHRISEILKRCETQSEQATALMDLATATGRTYNEINQLAKIIRSEGDLATEVIAAVKSLQSTLTSCRKRLDIGRYIEPLLSEPLLTKAAAMPTAPEYLFNTLLSTSASRIGTSARVIINPDGGYIQPCVFWTANVAHSGQAKTPPQQMILKPLEEMEATAKELHDIQMEDYDSDSDAKGKQPVRVRRLLNNVTSSTKIRIHDENQRGLLEYIDELVADYGRLNQYTNGKGDDLQLELSFWNGSGCNFDRHDANPKNSHKARLFLKRTALSKTGTYQWDTLARLMADDVNFIASGYSARFLYCSITDAPPRYLDLLSPQRPNPLKEKLQWLYGQLEKLPEADYLLSHEAKVLFQGWNHTLVNAEIDESHYGLSLVYAKIESYTARLALWLHLVNAVLRGEKPLPVISGSTMQHAIEIASFYLWQHKLIHAHNAPSRQLEGIFLKVQTQAEKFFAKCGQGVGASFLKTRINALKGWVVEKIRTVVFKTLANAGHGRIEGEGSEMVYVPNTSPATQPGDLVGIGGELVFSPIAENFMDSGLQPPIGVLGAESVDAASSSKQPDETPASSSIHQLTNLSPETFTPTELKTIGDTTNSLPIPPIDTAVPLRSPTAQEEAANLILQCSTWVELAQRVSKNASSLLAVTKTMTQEQRRSLAHLLANHLCQNPAELSALAWVPMKLRDRALDSLTFTIQRIGGKANSVLDACLEYVSGCRFVSLQQLGTHQEIWTFQTLEGKKIPVFGTEAIKAIALV